MLSFKEVFYKEGGQMNVPKVIFAIFLVLFIIYNLLQIFG